MKVKYSRHAVVDSMPDEKISVKEVEDAIAKAELRVKLEENKFKFRYRDVEVVCVKIPGGWLVVTCHRVGGLQ